MGMERFGDLLLMERLAAGGMAEVFRARQIGYGGFEKTVALKRILPHFASSEDFKGMFRAEANLCAMLQHPNITQVFGNGEEGGYLFLVMEFVDGKNLRQLLGKADKTKFRIPIEIACFLIGEAAKGLDYAHNFHDERTSQALNIVHRDVSPQNLMLGYEGSVKLVDFGIAKVTVRTESTRAGVLKGKFGYMSPEQARGEALDKRSDIFAMGIILWELLTQRRLFSSDDELKTLQNVRECKVPKVSSKNPTIPYSLEKIVMRALEKDQKNRYSTAGELYVDLVRYMNERHPNFIPTDFTTFMKDFFKEEIAEERKRREKLNLDAPAFMAKSPGRKPDTIVNYEMQDAKKDMTRTVSATDDSTLVSGVREEPKSSAKSSDLRESLNLDPSQQRQTQSNVSIPRIARGGSLSGTHDVGLKRIQVVKSAPPAEAASQPAKKSSASKVEWKKFGIRAGGLVVVLGIAGFILFDKDLTGRITQMGDNAISSVRQAAGGKTRQEPQSTENPPSAGGTDESRETPEVAVKKENRAAPVIERSPAANVFVWDPKKLDVYGTVSVSSVPDADMIFVNGKQLVDTDLDPLKTPVRELKLAPGSYQIELKNSVFGVTKTVTVDIEKNKIKKIEAFLNKR